MKELRCSDVGFDCQKVIQGDDDEDVMRQAGQHVRAMHGMNEIDTETEQKVRSAIHEAA